MRTLLAVAFCFFFLSGVAQAEMKVAVFNLQNVAANCDAFQEARKKMTATYESRRKEVEKKRTELENLGESMRTSATKEQQEKFRKAQTAYTEMANTYVQNLQKAELDSRNTMDRLISAAAKELAKEKGFTIILDSAAAVYFDPSMDVTSDMLTATNKVWKEDQKN